MSQLKKKKKFSRGYKSGAADIHGVMQPERNSASSEIKIPNCILPDFCCVATFFFILPLVFSPNVANMVKAS